MAESHACITPTPRQLAYQDWEFGLFVHFGLRSTDPGYKKWQREPMDLHQFNPLQLDCDRR